MKVVHRKLRHFCGDPVCSDAVWKQSSLRLVYAHAGCLRFARAWSASRCHTHRGQCPYWYVLRHSVLRLFKAQCHVECPYVLAVHPSEEIRSGLESNQTKELDLGTKSCRMSCQRKAPILAPKVKYGLCYTALGREPEGSLSFCA